MTREEQIWKEACHRYADSKMRNAFVAAVNWADSHPHWIPVEEELPPLHYEGANSTDFVLIWDGDDALIAYYNFKEKKWYNEEYGALIIPATHWMPIVPPRKEDRMSNEGIFNNGIQMPVQLREIKGFDWLAFKAQVAASILPMAIRQEPVANAQYKSADERAIERCVSIAEKLVQRLKGGEQ